MSAARGLALYDQTAEAAARIVISRYSTSFGMASRLLGPRVRPHVHNIYALVRIADEIVDGPARTAGLTPEQELAALDDLEKEVDEATRSGFSANLIVHAFARTARTCGIGGDLVAPFFASMRTDLTVTDHDEASHSSYVYGSAEVVGLMCLQAFVNAGRPRPRPARAELVQGARRLGSAFQNVNFLRDLDHDRDALGRDYLRADDPAARLRILDDIDADLDAAARVIPALPSDCRRAVRAAHDLFAALSVRLRSSPARPGVRVRVPDAAKAALFARAALGSAPRSRPLERKTP